MYEIIATENFIDIIREIPLRNVSVLIQSFLSIKKLDDNTECENTFIADLEKIESEKEKEEEW